MKKDISEDEWGLIAAIRNYRLARDRSPYYMEQYIEDCLDRLLDRY